MDRRGMIEGHLAQAERHVADGERHVAEQRARVEALSRDGHDTTESLLLLGQFLELQELHVTDRDRLRKELAAFSATGR
jgi:hypothetical protein